MPSERAAPQSRHSGWWAVGVCCAGLAACDSQPSATAADPWAQLEQRCIAAMVKNTCMALTGPEVGQTSDVVFVAGVGAINAQAYREIRASGEAMCSTVRQACERDAGSAPCRTGHSLWGVPPAGPKLRS